MKVSVILPVYGVVKYIEKCTQSLLEQTLDDIEFIFVDDHGPDDSIEIAKRVISGHKRESQFIFLKPEHNMGAGMARNFAIPHATGEYLAFVDSDDWIEPTMFEELYNEAKKHDNADLCYCQDGKIIPMVRIRKLYRILVFLRIGLYLVVNLYLRLLFVIVFYHGPL